MTSSDLPRKPKLHPGLCAVPYERGLVLEGTAQPRSFDGKAARTFLPRLLPLLDGSRTHADLARDLGAGTEQAVTAALRLLHSTGHLQEGDDDPEPPPGVPAGAAQALGRMLGADPAWPNVAAAYRAMHASPAFIVDTGPPAARVADLLAASGDRVTLVAPGSVPAAQSYVVGPAGETERDLLERFDVACFEHGLTWTWAWYAGGTLRLCRFDRRLTPCLACVRSAAHVPPAGGSGPDPSEAADLAWALVAGEILHQRARIGAPLPPGTITTFDLRAWSSHQDVVARRGDCERCGHLA
ncbi:hypothetical protein ACFFR3_32625 [Nonomuraea salmonea]|uniref:TOMM leader peptide-binding protein n=1 Tax=Nonomuraea salmonea TaxID=46181 RepID=A0ABV5NVI9_9ACTN